MRPTVVQLSNHKFPTEPLHYGEDPEPTTPPPGGAKVKLELAARSDSNLAAFAEAHVTAMTGNANFPTPTPSAAVFAQWLADFESMLSQYENARVALKNLTEQKDALRAGLCAVFSQRALYVEVASNGNPDVIATSGLPLRNPPSPVGPLPFPENLRVVQSQSVGELVVKWNSVAAAKSYVLQCAEVVSGQPPVWQQVYVGGKFTSSQKSLVPGKTYAFRVASIGGASGQSDWSPVVERMAA
ncbi:MAG: fibronectin type III domain-containing protein [Verrucomicrobiaceae bacterium]|nr:fibronectin type III domain-containing protein [Verrucomicrobiaceae bacterium]